MSRLSIEKIGSGNVIDTGEYIVTDESGTTALQCRTAEALFEFLLDYFEMVTPENRVPELRARVRDCSRTQCVRQRAKEIDHE